MRLSLVQNANASSVSFSGRSRKLKKEQRRKAGEENKSPEGCLGATGGRVRMNCFVAAAFANNHSRGLMRNERQFSDRLVTRNTSTADGSLYSFRAWCTQRSLGSRCVGSIMHSAAKRLGGLRLKAWKLFWHPWPSSNCLAFSPSSSDLEPHQSTARYLSFLLRQDAN